MHMGPNYILANISVDFVDHLNSTQIEEAIAGIDAMIKQNCPNVKKVFVEAEAMAASAARAPVA